MFKELNKIILALIFIILGWIIIVPAFEFPDEQAHFGSVSYLITHSKMPDGSRPDLTLEMIETQQLLGIFRDGYGNNKYTYHPEHHVEYSTTFTGLYELQILSLNNSTNRQTYNGSEAAKYPPLYYQFISSFTRLVDKHDILTRLFVTRLGNLVIVGLIAIVAYQIGIMVFGQNIYALTLLGITMLQPMFSFVNAGVNSDNLHNLLFTLVIYFGLRLIKCQLKLYDLLGLTMVIALDIYTKPQGFIAIIIGGFAVMLAVVRWRKWQMLWAALLIAAITIIVSAGEWDAYKGLFNVNNTHGISLLEYLRFSVNKLVAQNAVWYWGVFKWLGVVLPPIYWRIANRVVLLSVIGIMIYYYKVIKKSKTIADPYSIFFVLCTSLIYALTIFWFDYQHTKLNGYSLGIQARYFFPTIIAHMTVLLTGFTAWGWGTKSRSWLRSLLVVLFTLLQLGAIWHIVTIYYPGQNLGELIAQISQYKPLFIKGSWVYLWGVLYFTSVGYLLFRLLRSKKEL